MQASSRTVRQRRYGELQKNPRKVWSSQAWMDVQTAARTSVGEN